MAVLARGELPMGVRWYLWASKGRLYITLKRGPVRRTVYLGRAEGETAGEVAPARPDACRRLLREVAEAYAEAVELARRAAKAQAEEEMREALAEVATAPRALEEALEYLGRAEE